VELYFKTHFIATLYDFVILHILLKAKTFT
jgi:hypothetical protein